MPGLRPMPPIEIDTADLARFGARWLALGGKLLRTKPESSSQLGNLFDTAVGKSLAVMLGGISIVVPNARALVPAQADCVEVGPMRVVGGVRPQNFDVGYRPDGVRFAFDSKTLNDRKSIKKNWQNMINDLSTEATTVHTRFPHAVAAFMVIYPISAVEFGQRTATIQTLERMTGRLLVQAPAYMAEAISLVLWDPYTGTISDDFPSIGSPLRIERFSEQVERAYVSRYKGLPPHVEVEGEMDEPAVGDE